MPSRTGRCHRIGRVNVAAVGSTQARLTTAQLTNARQTNARQQAEPTLIPSPRSEQCRPQNAVIQRRARACSQPGASRQKARSKSLTSEHFYLVAGDRLLD